MSAESAPLSLSAEMLAAGLPAWWTPTVVQMGEWIPDRLSEFDLFINHTKHERSDWRWYLDYRTYDYDDLECVRHHNPPITGTGMTEAEARARLILSLCANGYLTTVMALAIRAREESNPGAAGAEPEEPATVAGPALPASPRP